MASIPFEKKKLQPPLQPLFSFLISFLLRFHYSFAKFFTHEIPIIPVGLVESDGGAFLHDLLSFDWSDLVVKGIDGGG